MNTVNIYRDDLLLTSVKPEEESSLSKQIMGDNSIKLIFTSSQRFEFIVGDKASFWGEEYFLTETPIEKKESTVRFKYEMTFRSSAYMLSRVQYLFLGADNSLKEADFSLTGKAKDFIDLMIQNLNRLKPEFSFTSFEIKNTDYKTISFDSVDCLAALGKIAEAFETEYFIDGHKISLSKINRDTGYTFRHGRNKGMYEITRKAIDSTSIITRIYPFGSDKNLPEGYRNYSKRLKMAPLPRNVVSEVVITRQPIGGGMNQFTFTWVPPNAPEVSGVQVQSRRYNPAARNYGQWGRPVDYGILTPVIYQVPFAVRTQFKFITLIDGQPLYETGTASFPQFNITGFEDDQDNNARLPLPVTEVLYLEKNIDKYGLHESTQIFDDIYPHRSGRVTSVNGANFYQFHDSTINFDLNNYLQAGTSAKVTFNTGQLSGYTFDISEYDPVSKRVTIIKNKSERTIDLPNFDLKPSIGDEYVFTDINMPQEYIDAAENELKTRAKSFLDQYSEPQLSYTLVFDPVFLRIKNYQLNLGDLIWVVDDDLKIQKKMRITSLTRKVVEEFEYEIELSDVISKTKLQALTSGQSNIASTVSDISKNIQNTSILNNRAIGDLIISQGTLQIESLPSKAGLTPIGIDGAGRIYRM